MRGKLRSQLNSKIPCGYELQFEFLSDRAVASGILCETPGGLALEFALAGVADVSADHESEQMLGIDAFSVSAGGKQRGKTHDRHHRLRTNSHYQSHQVTQKMTAPL